jgi:RNA polymerase sigma factor (sigma-70 family)
MLHHDRNHIAARQAELRADAAQRRPPADNGELERMVRAARSGDPVAFSTLVDRFSARVRGVARRHRLGAHDVDDVVQTTWLRLLEQGDSIREPRAIGAWLETTARRECLRSLRGAKREQPAEDPLPAETPGACAEEQRLVRAEERAALERALRALPARQRELLAILASEVEPSYGEIARELEMPIGSIGPTRARALERLRGNRALIEALR